MEQTATAQLVRTLLSEALDETEKTVFTLHYGEKFRWTQLRACSS